MGYAKYIGRVGALAVAAGIGVAVGMPGVAWADDTSSAQDSSVAASGSTASAGDATSAAPPAAISGGADGDDSAAAAPVRAGDRPGRSVGAQTTDDETPDEAGDRGVTGEEIDDAPAAEDDAVEAQHPATTDAESAEATPETDPATSDGESVIAQSVPAEPVVLPNTDVANQYAAGGADTEDAAAPLRVANAESRQDISPAYQGDDPTTPIEVVTPSSAARQAAAVGIQPAVQHTSFDTYAGGPLGGVASVAGAAAVSAISLTVSAAEAVVGPNGLFPIAFLWVPLVELRRTAQQLLSNNAPDIGPNTISLVVDRNTEDNVIGPFPATDADGDFLTYFVESAPANGTVHIAGNKVTYTPNAGFVGTDSFVLGATDANNGLIVIKAPGAGDTDSVTISITVEDPSRPAANDDAATVDEGGAVQIDVLDNDSAPAGTLDPATVLVAQPLYGSVTVDSNGVVTYISNGSEVTRDSFTYTVADDTGNISNTATVNLTVNPVDDAPVPVNDAASTFAGTSVLLDLVANDDDLDGGPKVITMVTQPMSGTVTIVSPSQVRYTPAPGFTGEDVFGYIVNDSGNALVRVTVELDPDNQAPVATPEAHEPDLLTGRVTGTMGATDPDGDDLVYRLVDQPAKGAVTVFENGEFTYTPTQLSRILAVNAGPQGREDSFTVEVDDGHGHLVPVQVVVDIDPAEIGVGASPIEIGGLGVAMAIRPDGAIAYAVKWDLGDPDAIGKVVVVNLTDNSVIDTIPLDYQPEGIAFSPNGAFAYLANPVEGTISVVGSDTVIQLPGQSPSPRYVVFNPDRSIAYVLDDNPAAPSVTVIDTTTHTVLHTIDYGEQLPPGGVAISNDGTTLYVSAGDQVAVITLDTGSDAVVDTEIISLNTDVNFRTRKIALSPDGSLAYIVSGSLEAGVNGIVTVMRTSDNALLGTIEVGESPEFAVFSPDGSLAYVPNYNDDTVSVINTVTHTVLDTLAVGENPFGITVAPNGTAYVVNIFGDGGVDSSGTVSVISLSSTSL